MTFHFPPPLRAGALAACVLLAGCAQLSPDGGFGPVQDIARQQTGATPDWHRTPDETHRSDARVAQLLQHDRLGSADDAVQIALINNPSLQAAFASLGVAEADLVQAGRLPNPGFSFARTHAGDDIKIERSLSLGLMKLLTLPATARIEKRRFEQVRLEVTWQVLTTATQTRQAYYKAVASQQGLVYQEQVAQAADAAHELAAQMAARGNTSRLDAARERLFYAETQTRLQRIRHEATQDKEALARALGVTPTFSLPDRLPELPARIDANLTAADAERLAIERRLDVQAARSELGGLRDSLGLTRATRFVNVLDLGALRTSETGKAPEIGYQVDIEIPLFDWGEARVAKAEAIYLQSANRLAAVVLDARSQARLAWREREIAFAAARRYRDEIVPLRRQMGEENLLRYNGMLISVFALLTDAREQAATVTAAIDAERDFWVADAALQLALGGTSATGETPSSEAQSGARP